MIARHVYVRLLASLTLGLMAGCAWVRPIDVDSEISGELASPSGTPKGTLDYFEQKYPPDSWRPASVQERVAVGPICLSRDALVQLTGDAPEEIQARAETGTTRSVLTVRRGDQDIFFYIARASLEAQSVVVEELVSSPVFRVYALDEHEACPFLRGEASYETMRSNGVRYYVDGTAMATDQLETPTRVHLRFVDTITQEIVCAATGEGQDLRSAARKAAAALAHRLMDRNEQCGMGG